MSGESNQAFVPRRSGLGMLRVLLVLAGLVLGGLANCASLVSLSAGFDAANRLYEQGKYREAAETYDKLLGSSGASAVIYFNLGNAWFKSGEIGRAIAAYQRAKELTPRDPDLQANLQFARNQVQGPTLSPAWWQQWLGRLTLNEWTVGAAAALWLLFFLLILEQGRPQWKSRLRYWVLAAGLTTLLLVGACAAAFAASRRPLAIVIARDTAIRQGPLNESPTAFMAHDGAELKVLDRKDEWLQVSADARRFGWVRLDQVIVNGMDVSRG